MSGKEFVALQMNAKRTTPVIMSSTALCHIAILEAKQGFALQRLYVVQKVSKQ